MSEAQRKTVRKKESDRMLEPVRSLRALAFILTEVGSHWKVLIFNGIVEDCVENRAAMTKASNRNQSEGYGDNLGDRYQWLRPVW